MYTQLNCKTIYSILSGIIRVDRLFEKAKEMGLSAVSISDKGNLSALPSAYRMAGKTGIKLISGAEIFLKEEDYLGPVHLIIKDYRGYQNLCQLISLSEAREGRKDEDPYITFEELSFHKEGLLLLSGGIDGYIQILIHQGKTDKAASYAKKCRALFGEDFYLEGQYHGTSSEKSVLTIQRMIGEKEKISLVPSNAPFYLEKKEARIHDMVLCMQERVSVKAIGRKKLPSEEYYFKSEEEMGEVFSEKEMNTLSEIIEKANLIFPTGGSYHMPEIDIPEGSSYDQELKRLSLLGFKKRYAHVQEEEVLKKLKERLFHELEIIKKMGYASYFLVVSDFIGYAKKNGIPVGPGRGSAAGSLVSYCTEITDIDPMDLGLLFERFLNPDRISMPDVDIDFCTIRREEVIDYVREKYGQDHVAQIITFGTLKAKGALRAVGRVYEAPIPFVNKLCSMIPTKDDPSIKESLERSDALLKLYEEGAEGTDEESKKARFLLDRAMEVEGIIYNSSLHAAGVIITDKPIAQYAPIFMNDEGAKAVQFVMEEIEEFGLIKFDFLGLRNLRVIQDTCDELFVCKGTRILPSQIDFSSDPEVFRMISSGDTLGIFQLESGGMTAVAKKVFYDVEEKLKELSPLDVKAKRALGHEFFERMIAIISLYRPGPMDYIDDYVRGMRHPERVVYDHPKLERILKNTYGTIVYQEQVMQIVQACAGYTLAEADNIRRIMSKKKEDQMVIEKEKFINGSLKEGLLKEEAERIWEKMANFCKYAFNKSHAAAYALVAYQTAYLKYFYRNIFLSKLLNSVIGNADKLAFYINTIKSEMKIPIRGVNVNTSEKDFSNVEGEISFGLRAVKGVGSSPSKAIVLERERRGPFKDIFDFVKRCTEINKDTLASLVKAGGFDFMKESNRTSLLAKLEDIFEYRAKYKSKEKPYTSLNLFEKMGIRTLPEIPLIERDEQMDLIFEKEATGMYLSGHPSAKYKELLSLCNPDKIADIREAAEETDPDYSLYNNGDTVVLAGAISEYEEKLSKNKNFYGSGSLEDFSGSISFILFAKQLENLSEPIQKNGTVILKGKLSIEEEGKLQVKVYEVLPCKKENLEDQKGFSYLLEKKKMIQKEKKVLSKEHSESTTEKQERLSYLSKTLWVRVENRKELDELMVLVSENNETAVSKKGTLKVYLESEQKVLGSEQKIALKKELIAAIQRKFSWGRMRLI